MWDPGRQDPQEGAQAPVSAGLSLWLHPLLPRDLRRPGLPVPYVCHADDAATYLGGGGDTR